MIRGISVHKDRNTYNNYTVYIDGIEYEVNEIIKRERSDVVITRKVKGEEFLKVMDAINEFEDKEKLKDE